MKELIRLDALVAMRDMNVRARSPATWSASCLKKIYFDPLFSENASKIPLFSLNVSFCRMSPLKVNNCGPLELQHLKDENSRLRFIESVRDRYWQMRDPVHEDWCILPFFQNHRLPFPVSQTLSFFNIKPRKLCLWAGILFFVSDRPTD